MIERRKEEMRLVAAQHGEVECDQDGAWILVRRWPLPAGWAVAETPLLIVLPPGYPATPPYGFFTDPGVRLAGGGEPSNSSLGHTQLDQAWRQFSFTVEEWQPHADAARGHNLATFLLGVGRRLAEVN
jgi:hypothetical protein